MATAATSADDLLHSPPTPNATRRRPAIVTVDDIKSKTCWICQEGDEADSEGEQEVDGANNEGVGKSKKSKKRRRRKLDQRRRFVHPCNCTLVAHEACLLTWIKRKTTRAQPTVKCPQCAHPYQLVAPASLLLRAFEQMESGLTKGLALGTAVAACAAAGSIVNWYGELVLRAWVGGEALRQYLRDSGGDWTVSNGVWRQRHRLVWQKAVSS